MKHLSKKELQEVLHLPPKVKKVKVLSNWKPKERVTLVCKNCKIEFKVQEFLANQGRLYCTKGCSDIGRGFKIALINN